MAIQAAPCLSHFNWFKLNQRDSRNHTQTGLQACDEDDILNHVIHKIEHIHFFHGVIYCFIFIK